MNSLLKPSRPFLERALPSALVWLCFLACCLAPLAWMIVALVTTPDAYAALHPLPFHLRLLARTLLYNGAVAAVATLLALPVAIVLGRGRGGVAGALAFVLPAALLLPSITYAYGWMQVLRGANDFAHAHDLLKPLGVSSVYPMPGSAGDVVRCVWTLATWLWPIPAGVIGLSFRRLDADLQQQALLDGGYWRVVARQLLAPAVAAFAVVAILAMQEFAVYEPTGISVVATEVRTVFETGQVGALTNPIDLVASGQFFSFARSDQRRNAAAALVTALPQLAVFAALGAAAVVLARRNDSSDTIDPGHKPRILRPARGTVLLAAGVILVTLVLPLLAMVFSLKREPDLARVWRTFSPPVLGSLTIALLAGITATLLAGAATVKRFTWPLVLGILTFLIGGQMLAIALIRLYNHPSFAPGYWVYNGPVIVVMAYVARFGWLAMFAGRSTWSPRWRQVRDMAAVDGAGGVQTARHVLWPLCWPLIAACGVLVMLLSMTEVPATVLLNPLRPQVFVPQLMTWVHTLRSDDMLEGSLLLAGIVIVLATVVVALLRLALVRRAPLRAAAKQIALLAVALTMIGCSGGDQPDEVWLETGAGEAQTVYPRAITYSKADDTYFICDRLGRIQHLDARGKFLHAWRTPEIQSGKPVGLTAGPDGNLWVPDTHYSRVMVYAPDGKLLKTFGKFGHEPGQFVFPSDVAFDARGRVFISEFGDHDRIQVFDKDLNFLYQFGKFGDKDGEFSRPQSMVIATEDGRELLYATDACNHRITVWTTDGQFVRNMCRIGSQPGELRFPYGLDIDSDGRLVVCEFGNNRVQLLDRKTGKGLKTWGTGGRELGQMAYPWAVAVDKRDRIIAVDSGNNRLQVFEF